MTEAVAETKVITTLAALPATIYLGHAAAEYHTRELFA